jgi:hypothetical protein
MQLPFVKIVNGQGGLQRQPTGSDFISGLIAYMTTLPSGFSSNARTKIVNSVAQAEGLGINYLYSDATAQTGVVQITSAGNNGDTLTILHLNVKGVSVNLGTYTKSAAQANANAVATAVAAVINAGTNVHGYTASAATSNVTITIPKFNGISPGTISTVITGAITTGITQATGGSISPIAVLRYHIGEYFRIIPNGSLYVHIPGSTYGTNFEEITTLRNFAEGKIRQVAIMHDLSTALATTQVTKIQAQMDAAFAAYRPMVALFAPEISGTADLSSLVDLSGLDSEMVSVQIGQDAGGTGGWLYRSNGKSISDLGAKLGVLALSKVSDSWAWVGAYNMSDGTELNTIGFSNGTTYATAETNNVLDQLATYGYCFLRKITDFTGTYNTQPNTATLETSDYRYLYSNRVIQKAGRVERQAMIPFQSSPIILNSDGTMTDVTIETFSGAIGQQLDVMVRAGELSNYAVTINPAQNVLSTSSVDISVALLPVGVADYITITNRFTVTLA